MVIHSGIIYCLRKNNVYEENNYFYEEDQDMDYAKYWDENNLRMSN